MKKWIGAMVLMTLMQTAFAQDFKKVETSLILNNFELAKTEYEKAVTKKPSLETTAEGYYWKSKIYAGLYKDPAAKYPDAADKLYKSLEDYIKADTAFSFAVKSGQEPFFEVFSKSFRDGVTAFGEKKWVEAAANFDRGVFLSDIIFSKGWSPSKQSFDTTTLMYAGYANQNAGNEEATIKHYTRMMDANMKSPDLIDIYKYVLIKAAEKKNKALFDQSTWSHQIKDWILHMSLDLWGVSRSKEIYLTILISRAVVVWHSGHRDTMRLLRAELKARK